MARNLPSAGQHMPLMAKPLRYPRDTLSGRTRPYRPCPPDFRDRFIELGWEAIGEHYRAGWAVIARWIDRAGGDDLRQARAARAAEVEIRRLHVVR